MARKKREIQKRKKQVDSGTDNVREAQGVEKDHKLSKPVKDVQSKGRKTDRNIRRTESKAAQKGPAEADKSDTWFSRNKENFLLSLLLLYVFLLGLGTAGELFEIEWILNLPLFK